MMIFSRTDSYTYIGYVPVRNPLAPGRRDRPTGREPSCNLYVHYYEYMHKSGKLHTTYMRGCETEYQERLLRWGRARHEVRLSHADYR